MVVLPLCLSFSDLAANRTLDMIEEFTSVEINDTRKPFLAVLSWPSIHGPFTVSIYSCNFFNIGLCLSIFLTSKQPAPWTSGMFQGIKVPRHPNYNASSEFQEQKHWLVRQISEISIDREHHMDYIHRERMKGLQSVDRHIGAIMTLIEKKGELNNTYFIYTSDNGFNLGNHRLGDKRHLYEADIRVPFVVAGPGIPRNVTTDRVVLNSKPASNVTSLIFIKKPFSTPPYLQLTLHQVSTSLLLAMPSLLLTWMEHLLSLT